MTGEAFGKIKLENAKIVLIKGNQKKEVKGKVFIHLKGFALAKVTHLDIEANELENLIEKEKGDFLIVCGINGGIRIRIKEKLYVEVYHDLLNKVLKENERIMTWVGKKEGGIYIGFKKKYIEKLEKIAREDLGFKL